MLLALRIEVDSLAAARDAVPRLVELLQAHDADASFFFNLGPDRSGLASGPLFQIGDYGRQIRYNQRLAGPHGMARLYGRLMPAPEVGKQAAAILRTVRETGYETGLLAWDRVNWIKRVSTADQAWLETELKAAHYAYENLLGSAPDAIALPGWRLSPAALRLEQRLGFKHASDTRGQHPFLPVINGEPVRVAQFPTTLPTLQELTGHGSQDDLTIPDRLLAQTERLPAGGHVFTIQAAADTGKRLPLLQRLFAGWREQGHEIGSLRRMSSLVDHSKLPWHHVDLQPWPGYKGVLAVQGDAFPG